MFACGDGGVFVRSSNGGATWTNSTVDSSIYLHGIWGRSPNELYLVGFKGDHGVILHSSDGGSSWSQQSTQKKILWGVWGNEQRVYASSPTHAVYSTSDGQSWLQQSQTVGGVRMWGSGPNDVYALNNDGLAHSDDQGTSWQTVVLPVANLNLFDIWGSGARDV